MTDPRLGVRAYAKHRRCAPSSVTKAIQAGRLTERSVQRCPRGRPLIDPAKADREWLSNTNPLMLRDR